MSTDVKESTQTPVKDLEKEKLLWDEYKYRHEHCWKLIFQITAAVVILLIIPYVRADIAKSLTYWMVFLPALGILLTLFSMLRLNRELDVLDSIRTKHRELQKALYGIPHKNNRSRFSRDVNVYLGGLVLIGAIDIIAIVWVWMPTLR